ncbi:MerR family transcriptional regulator [Actinoplanes utahensis]|uniref:MerR family transcriptional regulator n=1 Tax=Actinoplanes utahensis TaxID=1869 RepID=A0A0A6UKB7_ACTUT|nr:MerR family transcriptional regulator [Actinoplanes utahensis]KHD75513.1 MerR family transcriptional regulator [Actinoplanes utahensis]GIF32303.1 MerR family transcriptional regulator [Actinoplanes utahensis]
MRMGEMVRRTGVSERLLRYYESQGLLHPMRTPSGYRIYAEADVRTVGRIRRLLAAGLGTATIARILPCIREDGHRLMPTCPQLVSELQQERDRMTAAIEDLRISRGILDTVISAGPSGPARSADASSLVPSGSESGRRPEVA